MGVSIASPTSEIPTRQPYEAAHQPRGIQQHEGQGQACRIRHEPYRGKRSEGTFSIAHDEGLGANSETSRRLLTRKAGGAPEAEQKGMELRTDRDCVSGGRTSRLQTGNAIT